MMARRLVGWFNRLPWLVTLCVVCVAALGGNSRPLHADEAGQWSLLSQGRPHSETSDQFHGPALVLLARGACALLGADPEELSETSLRLIPLLFGLTLLWPVMRRKELLLAILVAFALFPLGRFIQEPILAVALTWVALLWLKSEDVSPDQAWRWRAAAGVFAGLALACKVTAALYLSVAAVAYLWVDRRAPGRRGLASFGLTMLLSWALWQSSWLRDLPALATWWSQLGRAFGLASGVTAEPLRLVAIWPWVLSGLCLVCAAFARWRRRDVGWGWHPLDPLLATAVLIYVLHLILPYQTPWLMMSVDTLVLVVLLPGLLPRWQVASISAGTANLRAVLALIAAVCVGRWALQSRYAYVETRDSVPLVARAIHELTGASRLTIQVKGANYWPLPYYLRDLRVGYGDFPGSEQADVRWIEATGPEAPSAPGYRVFPVELRAGETWWLLVRETLSEKFSALR